MKKKYIIVGAGKNGKRLLERLGPENVSFFADNNAEMTGKTIRGIKVISVDELAAGNITDTIIISIEDKAQITDQLERQGISDYVICASDWKKERLKEKITDSLPAELQDINEILMKYSSETEKIDPIDNVEEFKDLVDKCKKDKILKDYYKGGCYNINGRDWESRTYGHYRAIKQYAGLDDDMSLFFPVIPHAPFAFDNIKYYSTATAFSSYYLKEISNKKYPYVPAFVLGEYMQYVSAASKNASEDDAVVVFMHHSIEFLKVQYKYDHLMKTVFTPLLEKYSTVILSVYWYDLDDPLYKMLSDAGVRIVSAGFRFDDRFLFRLSRIIDMAEDIMVTGRTSALIYALARGRRLFYQKESGTDVNVSDPDQNHRFTIADREKDILTWENILTDNYGKTFSEYSSEDQKIIDRYFGLSVHRSSEEIKVMYEISRDIWQNSNYIEEQYPAGVYKTYWDYQIKGEFDKLTMLSEALPAGFWNL